LIRLRLTLRAAFHAVCLATLGSLYKFLEHSVVQSLVGHQLLEPAVFCFELLEAFDRVALSSSILLFPAVVGLHAHADLARGFLCLLAAGDDPCGFT
jgi:hypothetical protein